VIIIREKIITLRLTPEEYEIIYSFIKDRGLNTMSDGVRELLNHINNNKKQLLEDIDYHKGLYEKKKKRLKELEDEEEQKKLNKDDLVSKAKAHLKKQKNEGMC